MENVEKGRNFSIFYIYVSLAIHFLLICLRKVTDEMTHCESRLAAGYQ